MSRIGTFAAIERNAVTAQCRELLRAARRRLERMTRDINKDGADREALAKAFADIDKALAALS